MMARPKSYRELIVWQKAMALAREVYGLSQSLPKTETYGLVAQIKRSAVSVPSNIAEGHGRLTDLQFRHFLGNARGSLCELQTQLELAADISLLNKERVQRLMEQGEEVARLINGLLASFGRGEKAGEANANSASSANAANSAQKRPH
jgi:four helix bundle protein